MVEKYFILDLNFALFKQINNDKNTPFLSKFDKNDGYNTNNEKNIFPNNDKNGKSKHKYVKVLVDDPFNNRNIILELAKKQRGVYL